MPVASPAFQHEYSFDPSYGYDLEKLKSIAPPEAPEDFAEFWQERYAKVIGLETNPVLGEEKAVGKWIVRTLAYQSTDQITIRGWVLLPADGKIERGFVCGHGYGGIEGPDFDLPFENAVLFFPCLRGLGASTGYGISSDPNWHVLHDIDKPDEYIHGGCVEDFWLGVSAMLELFPELEGHIGMLGVSFGGGIGMLALPWDDRVQRAHFEVPSFGHHPLRLTLETCGSGGAVNAYQRRKGNVLDTLQYYDAATAATFAKVPVQIAVALFDPFVAPPGQFAIYNALPGEKGLFLLSAGHFEYDGQEEEREQMIHAIETFFSQL